MRAGRGEVRRRVEDMQDTPADLYLVVLRQRGRGRRRIKGRGQGLMGLKKDSERRRKEQEMALHVEMND